MKRSIILHTESPENFARQFSSGATGGNDRIAFSLLPDLGEGVLTVVPFSNDVEVMLFNITRLDKELQIDFIPDAASGFYFIQLNDFIGAADTRKGQPAAGGKEENTFLPGIHLSDGSEVHRVFYPKAFVLRSAIIKVRKNSLPALLPDDDGRFAAGWNALFENRGRVLLPINFKYRMLLKQLTEETGTHSFPELFIIKTISSFLRVLRDQVCHHSSGEQREYHQPVAGDAVNLFRVERYLTDNYKAAFPGVQQLSRLSMMSPTKLKSGFRRFFGYTLFDYYQKYRLEQAKMLLQKNLPVKIVAAEFGYSNPSHFSLAFRKEFGIPPSKLDAEPYIPEPGLAGLLGNARQREASADEPPPAPFNKADMELMRMAEEYILREYCSDTFTVQQLVKQIAVNYNRLNLLFKSKYGMKVSEYIRLMRIEKSREMIAGGDKSISEIAYEIGYSSISNYILAFKKVHQVTPGNYRRQIA